jgi:hypothetical protein
LDPHRLIETASLIMPFSAFPNDTKSHAPYQNRLNRDPFVYRISEGKSPDLEPRTKKAKFVEAAAKVEQADAEHPKDKMYIDYLQNNRYLDTPLLPDSSLHLDNLIHPIFNISNFDDTHGSTALVYDHK